MQQATYCPVVISAFRVTCIRPVATCALSGQINQINGRRQRRASAPLSVHLLAAPTSFPVSAALVRPILMVVTMTT